MHEHGKVRERREDSRADAHGQDRGRGRLAVGCKVQAGDGADAESMHGRESFSDGARRLDHGDERERGGDEEQRQRERGDASCGVVATVARAGDEGALDQRDCEAGVDDLERGSAGGFRGNKTEIQTQKFAVVCEFVVGDGLGQRVVPDGVGGERGAGVFGEGQPQPAVERRGEREGHDDKHQIQFHIACLHELRVERAVGGAHAAEVDEHDGGGPVELAEALVPKIHSVEHDRQEEQVHRDGAARGLAADERGDAVAVARRGGTFVQEIGAGGEGLQNLPTETHQK